MTILIMSPVSDNDQGGWKKRLTGIHGMGCPICLVIKTLLCHGHPLVSIHTEHKYLYILWLFKEVYQCISPQISFSLVF